MLGEKFKFRIVNLKFLTTVFTGKILDTFVVPLHPVLVFLVVLARVGGLVTFAPFWSHRVAPAKVRVILAFAVTLVVTPAVMPKLATLPAEIGTLMLVLVGELVIGLALGFVGRIIFSGLEMAAFFVGSQMGFNLAGTIDPSTNAQTAAFGTIAQMLGLMILLAADGHHWFLAATIRSFASLAPGASDLTVSPQLAELFVRMTADALAVGVALAAPAIIVLLVVEFALAVYSQAAPQLQIFVLSFPVKIAVGLSLLGASLYFLPAALRGVLSGINDGLLKVLGAV